MRKLIVLPLLLILTSCGAANYINDFFGIQMNPDDERLFNIVSYDEMDGIRYQSSADMDANIIAWAEIGTDDVTFKLVNQTLKPILFHQNSDRFLLVTDEKEYEFSNESAKKYFKADSLKPKSNNQVTLKMPKDFIEKYKIFTIDKELTDEDIERLEEQKNKIKNEINYFVIRLSDRQFVLKQIPEQN